MEEKGDKKNKERSTPLQRFSNCRRLFFARYPDRIE